MPSAPCAPPGERLSRSVAGRARGPRARPAGAGGPDPRLDTPYLALDVEQAAARYGRIAAAFPGTWVHYAVRANPHPALLGRLVAAGARFGVASPVEVDACLAAGADRSGLLATNPVRKRRDMDAARLTGVRTYVVDSVSELHKVAQQCPGADVLSRLATSGEDAGRPPSGADAEECVALLAQAPALGLGAAGVAFHVRSRQREPSRWREPIRQSAEIFARLRGRGIGAWLLDLGGGLPADHEGGHPPLATYAAVIEEAIATAFGPRPPQTIVEPGRAVAGEAGTLVASVVGVCWRGDRRWVYLDAGEFCGLVETVDQASCCRVDSWRDGRPLTGRAGPAVLAGPSGDSGDVRYERAPVALPVGLAEGDLVRLRSAGAYTATRSSVGSGGAAPLPTRLVTAG